MILTITHRRIINSTGRRESAQLIMQIACRDEAITVGVQFCERGRKRTLRLTLSHHRGKVVAAGRKGLLSTVVRHSLS